MTELLVIVFLIVFHFLAMYLAGRRLKAARVEILNLALSLKKEQRLTTQLREMLSKAGVETIVTPTDGDYDLSFKVHFPSPNVVSALRAWRGPVRH